MSLPKVTSELSTPIKRKNSPIKLEDIYELNLSIGNDLRVIKSDVAELKSFSGAILSRTQVLEENYEKIKERCEQVDLRLNSIEQHNLRFRMEIKGVDESAVEKVKNWKAYVVEILSKFNVRCEEDKIERAYRKMVNTTRPFSLIVVWFYDENEKIRVMKEKFDHQKKNSIRSDIYLNHCLTSYNRALYTKALKVKSMLGMEMVFIRNGRITMKQNHQSKPFFVSAFEDIDKLLSSINVDK